MKKFKRKWKKFNDFVLVLIILILFGLMAAASHRPNHHHRQHHHHHHHHHRHTKSSLHRRHSSWWPTGAKETSEDSHWRRTSEATPNVDFILHRLQILRSVDPELELFIEQQQQRQQPKSWCRHVKFELSRLLNGTEEKLSGDARLLERHQSELLDQISATANWLIHSIERIHATPSQTNVTLDFRAPYECADGNQPPPSPPQPDANSISGSPLRWAPIYPVSMFKHLIVSTNNWLQHQFFRPRAPAIVQLQTPAVVYDRTNRDIEQSSYEQSASSVARQISNLNAAIYNYAIQLMPYRANTMRAFKQPSRCPPVGQRKRPAKPELEEGATDEDKAELKLVDEYSDFICNLTMKQPAIGGDDDDGGRRAADDNIVIELDILAKNHDPNNNANGRRRDNPPPASTVRRQPASAPVAPPCDVRRKLALARDKNELCFWFDVAGSLEAADQLALEEESMVEAELHLYKLAPLELRPQDRVRRYRSLYAPSRVDPSLGQRHLRTNLLEVSLYQVLGPFNAEKKEDEETLRLLDIRRVDLNSTGWEIFYMKRALDDWLRRPATNFGLLVRAKSMFNEPIQLGSLIRFADFENALELMVPGDGKGQQQDLEARGRFLASHQPLLVMYTNKTTRELTHRLPDQSTSNQ